MRRPTKAELARALKEIQRKKRKPWDPIAALTTFQRGVFEDKSTNRVLEGTRQLGKSRLAAVELIDCMLQRPNMESAFLDFDITHAEKILLADFEALLDEYQIDARIVNGELLFENGSVVYLFSGKPSEIKKLQGLKFAMLVADECQDSESLEEIVKMVRPALMRYGGRLLFCGIPGRMKGIGYWWDITNGDKAGLWSQHRGHMNDNPFLPVESREEQRAAALADYGSDQHPDYLRHWCGIWPDEDNALRMFRYSREKNGYDGVAPPCAYYSLGLDPGGVQDAEAVVMIGANPDGNIYGVDEDVSEKRQGGDWDVTGERVGPMVERWHPSHRYYDYGSVKKGALSLIYGKDLRVLLEAVPEKDPEQEAMRINRLFAQGKLWVKRGSKLERDLLFTVWDAKSLAAGKPKQNKAAYKQNACDALRAALWGVDGYAQPIREEFQPETEEQRIRRILDSQYNPPVTLGPQNRYDGVAPPKRTASNGTVKRAY